MPTARGTGGSIAELGLGDPEAADLNADGDVTDTLLVVVTRARDGWVLFADTRWATAR